MSASASEQDYQVRFVGKRRSSLWRAMFFVYAAAATAFIVWRSTVVNWHVWIGPVALFTDLFSAVTFVLLLWHVRHPEVPVHRPVDLARFTVDCLIPTHTESVDIVESTVIGAVRIHGVRRVLVLGNNYREDIREMAARLGVDYHARNSMEFGKAGNLNAGLAHTDADYIVTLDADHIPRPDLLERTLGYFDDPTVALVQTPQSFYNTDSFAFRQTRGGRLWTEAQMFYSKVQPSKNHSNASFYVGTSAVLRRRALDETDGFGTGTVTEDIHTALRLHSHGWHSVFVPEPVAFGLEAASLREFYSQRRRWALGSLQLLFRHRDSPLRRPGLTPAQRMHYLHSVVTHLGGPQRLFYLLLPTVTLLTMTSPVLIPFSWYALVFLGYTLASWTMMKLYFGHAYHPVHSESYTLASSVAQTAALLGLFRQERRFHAANKQVVFGERTWVKALFWTILLTCIGTVGYGVELIFHGQHNGMIISAVLWSGLHGFWIGALLLYLLRYEQRPQPFYEQMPPMTKYEWVMAEGERQVQEARTAIEAIGTPAADSLAVTRSPA